MTHYIQGVDTSNLHGTGLREGTTTLACHHNLATIFLVGAVLTAGEVEFGVFRIHKRRAFLFGGKEVGKFLSSDAVFFFAGGSVAGGSEDDFVVVVADPTGTKVGVFRRVHLFQLGELIF